MPARGIRAVQKVGQRLAQALCIVAVAVLPPWLALTQPASAAGRLGYAPASTGLEPQRAELARACPPPTSTSAQCLSTLDPTSAAPLSSRTAGASPNACFVGENEYCGAGVSHGLSAQDLESAYKLPSATAGTGQTVAIVDAYDDPDAQSDLNVYRSTYGIPACEAGCFSKVNQTGGTTYPEANADWSLEISLDLDMVSAACPNCHILLVEASTNSLENLGLAENEAATLGATEISNSYSANEAEVEKPQLEGDSKYYTHPGIPITVASGDNSYDNTNPCADKEGKCINVAPNFPAGLSTVVSVGGTTLYPEGEVGRGWKESVWFYSGSGCTLYVAKPSWQTDKGCANRTDNDVAAEASPTTPVSVYDTYSVVVPGWQLVGGTSASTPLVAGTIALESGTLRSEGDEGIYKHSSNWFDVTEGSNYPAPKEKCPSEYLCKAQIGYDGPSGVGTPDGGATATPPSAVTEPASGVTTTAATLNAVVNPEATPTTYYFQYGPSAVYTYGEIPLGGSKTTTYTKPTVVSQAISGLQPAAVYHYRIVAKSAGGTTYGADRTFSSAPKVYASKFGSKGTTEGAFESPQSVTTDVHGDVWVSDYVNDRIEEFSPTGAFLRMCGSKGSGEGQLNGPTGIAVNPASDVYRGGYVYVSDSGNGRIEVFSPECKYTETIGKPGSGVGQLSDPVGLAFGFDGTHYYRQPPVLVVADSGNNRLEEFTWQVNNAQYKAGEYFASYGSKGSGEGQFMDPTDVALVGTEHPETEEFDVVDSGNNRIQEIEEEEITTSHEAVSFKHVRQFGSKGAGEGQLSGPTAVAVDPTTGDVDVTDTANNSIEEFLPSGTYIARFGSGGSGNEAFSAPKGIAVDADGDVYVADSGNIRVDVWQPSQQARPQWAITSTPNPLGTLDSYLWGVSCVSGSASCSAVGEYTKGEGSKSEPVAEWWNGVEWTLQSPTSPSEYSTLNGVSCATASWCVGVALYKNTAGTYLSLAESWNGTKWADQATPEPSGTLNSGFDAVSCTSASACTAVGEYETSSSALLPFADRWNGTEWKVESVPNPTGAKETYATGVSCTSSTSCTMAGTYKSSSNVYLPYAASWNGTEWKLQAMPIPSGSTSTRVHGGVSCTSAAACTATGYYLNGAGTQVTLAERWNGTEWSVESTPNDGKGEGWLSGGVSCSAITSCAAVGNTGTTFAELYR